MHTELRYTPSLCGRQRRVRVKGRREGNERNFPSISSTGEPYIVQGAPFWSALLVGGQIGGNQGRTQEITPPAFALGPQPPAGHTSDFRQFLLLSRRRKGYFASFPFLVPSYT